MLASSIPSMTWDMEILVEPENPEGSGGQDRVTRGRARQGRVSNLFQIRE